MGSFYKRVDKSLLNSGKITIPDDEIMNICDVSGWLPSQKKVINLLFNDVQYSATIAYKERNANTKSGKPYYQLSYGDDLSKELKKEFIQTFIAIQAELISSSFENKYHITSDNINREVIQFKKKSETEIEIIPFLKLKTQYDNLFKTIIETNLLNLDKKEKKEDIIVYASDWLEKDEINKYRTEENVVYYLVDTINKEVYIGSAKNLYNRLKNYRKEIPNWNLFKYEKIHPKYKDILERIEHHSIRAFASFLTNSSSGDSLQISSYKLNNKNWAKRK